MEPNNYQFRILGEKSSEIDELPDQTYEKVANTLCRLLSLSDRGVTIGLEGGWGSGKSTVVTLLQKKLRNTDKNTLIFKFDAWAHEGDPLRRIFLESLIEEIDPEAKNSNLENLKKEISGRERIVEVKSRKKRQPIGWTAFISCAFCPDEGSGRPSRKLIIN